MTPSTPTNLEATFFKEHIWRRFYIPYVIITSFTRRSRSISCRPSSPIQFNMWSSISLSEIGKALNFNQNYISRLFKQNTGISLKQYILEKKITYAQSLLSQGYSVTDTCYKSGFVDYSNFIRTFKQYTGETPGAFKKHTLKERLLSF